MRLTLSLVLSVLAIAGAVFYASESQRKVADDNYAEAIVARQLAADMLSRENLLHEYIATGRTQTAASIYELDHRQKRALAQARELSADSREELQTLDRQSEAAARWDEFARTTITGGNAPSKDYAAAREKAVDDFAAANLDYQQTLDARRVEELKAAALVPVKLMITLSIAFGAIALALVARRRRAVASVRALEREREDAEERYAEGQARFGEAMQVAENQGEGHELLIRHLEAGAPEAKITVLIRNNSGDRLEPAVPLPEDSPLAEPLEHAKPRGCLAVRLSRPVDQGPSSREIIPCEVCGAQAAESTCQPLLVGGEVIGSVLTSGDAPPATPSAAASATP